MRRLACGAVVVIAFALVACSGGSSGKAATPKPTGSQSATVRDPVGRQSANFTGTGDTTTSIFTVTSNWELRFETAGKITIELVDTSGSQIAQLVKDAGPGGGSVFPSQSGAFAVRVSARSKWRIQIISH